MALADNSPQLVVIPRGARYARNGSVKSVVFDGNKIKAKVQGSRVRPYTVTMVINKFSESEKERLIDGILAKPSIVPQLLNMNLSPAVLDIAKEARLKVSPSSWRDLDMDCDCPDCRGENWIGKLSNKELKEIFG